MTLKTVLMGSAFCLGVLALSPLANAAGLDKKVTIVGASAKATDATANQTQETRLASKDATAKSVLGSEKPALSSQIAFVAKSTAAHTAKTGHGKPAEQANPTSIAPSTAGAHQAKSQEMAVIGKAMKAASEKNNAGKPSEPSGSGGGSGVGAGSSHAIQVVAAARKSKAEKNNGGKPSDSGSTAGNSGSASSSHSHSFGGSHYHSAMPRERVGAMSPNFRGSPGERATSHCNGRGMCF
jgi:hypothetical protein